MILFTDLNPPEKKEEKKVVKKAPTKEIEAVKTEKKVSPTSNNAE